MQTVKREKSIWRVSLVLMMLAVMTLTGTVYGKDKGGDAPEDPGVGTGQDNTKTDSTQWVLPHGETVFIGPNEYNIVQEWGNFLITSSREPGEGDVVFLGIGGFIPVTGGAYEDTSCGSGNGLQSCNDNGNGNGNSNGGGPLHEGDDCGGVWITPGKITASAQQIAPANALVIGQDPAENGVTLEWHVTIAPTTVSYSKWEIVAHRKVACVEGAAGEPYPLPAGVDEDCPHGWHSIIQQVWACASKNKTYQEGIADLSANATLRLSSRAWIQGELAAAYPGAGLKNPDWGFSTTPSCVWSGDVCNWDFTLTIPVADPGWYDLKVVGQTAGNTVTPPRSFEVMAGEFGAYMFDSSEMIH